MALETRAYKRVGLGAAAVLAVFALTAYVKRGDSAAEPAPRYTVARVSRGDIVRSVTSTGQLMPWVTVEVSSQISGLVTEVNADFNSVVRKGHVLARIDPATYEQRLRQAEADLAAAQANATLARVTARRLQGLREQDLVTQEEYDQARAQLEQAQATLLTRQAAVENARVDLQRCTITSPIDGVVIYRQIEVGKTVVSSFSAPTLFVIAQDLSRMRIIAPISEVDVWAVHPGQPVTFTVDAIPDRIFHGRLTQIRNPYTPSEKQSQQQAAQQSGITTFDAVIDVDNRDLLLRPSLTANVSIVVSQSRNALRVPNGALRVSLPELAESRALQAIQARLGSAPGDSAIVYRLPGGDRRAEPEPVLVHVGVADNLNAEILDGLREGDVVITGMASRIELPKRPGLF